MEAPRVPKYIERALKNFDPRLRLEWCGNHWRILDTSKILNAFWRTASKGYIFQDGTRVNIEIKKPVIRYDVVMHLQPDRELSTSIIDELNYRRMDRWDRPKDFIDHVERQLEKGEADKDKEIDDFALDTACELKTLLGSPESVTINGRKQSGP